MNRLKYFWNRIARFFGNRLPGFASGNNEMPLFLIFNPAWPDPPRRWYATHEAASADAWALAVKQPQDSFYVLKAVSVVSRGPIVTKELPGGPE